MGRARNSNLLGIALVVIVGCSLFGAELASADGPPLQWQKTFGGSERDDGFSVQQTSDGGYIIAGRTYSFGAGNRDVYLIMTEPNGSSQWQKTFGGSKVDDGFSVQQTSDGGYVIAGYSESFGAGEQDVYLIKTDANGNSQWQKTYGGSMNDQGFSVQQTSDDGYVIAGYSESFGAGEQDVYLIKTDANGSSQWQKTYGGSMNDQGNSVQQTAGGGYIIAGSTTSFGAGNRDVYLIKTEPNGSSQWQKTFGGENDDFAQSVQQTSDGGYVIVGHTYSFGAGSSDVYLIKTEPNGNSQWEKTFGGSRWDLGNSVQQTKDGGFIIAGHTYSFGTGEFDVYLIKTDANGNSQWQKTFGGSLYDHGDSVQQTLDGGYIIAGATYSFGAGEYDVYLIKLCSEGMKVSMKLTPRTLNCSSKGNWVKAHFTLPEGFTTEEVDSNISGEIDSLGVEADYVDVFVDEDGLVRVEMAFDRTALCDALADCGTIEITVKCLIANGRCFYGTDIIKIIDTRFKHLASLSSQ